MSHPIIVIGELEAHLDALAGVVRDRIDALRRSGVLRPGQPKKFRRTTILSETPTSSSSTTTDYTRESWIWGEHVRTWTELAKSQPYQAAERLLPPPTLDSHGVLPRPLHALMERMTILAAREPATYAEKAREQIQLFIREMTGELLPFRAVIYMVGVIAKCETFSVAVDGFNCRVRAVTREDNEREIEVKNQLPSWHYDEVPTAIVEMSGVSRDIRQIERAVGRLVAGLRLFAVGSVNTIYTEIDMASFYESRGHSLDTVHVFGKPRTEDVYERFILGDSRCQRFIGFWNAIGELIPAPFFLEVDATTTPLLIAFERYCDGLRPDPVFERRIASAVMGLEALLSEGGAELKYKLQTRVAKLLGTVEYPPLETSLNVGLAYKVRSRFVHGDRLTAREARNYTQSAEGAEAFAARCLDYLRCTIAVFLLCNLDKEKVIRLIDQALLDRSSETALEQTLVRAVDLVADHSEPYARGSRRIDHPLDPPRVRLP